MISTRVTAALKARGSRQTNRDRTTTQHCNHILHRAPSLRVFEDLPSRVDCEHGQSLCIAVRGNQNA